MMAQARCIINSLIPNARELNIIKPTLDIKNIGEEVEQKVDALTASKSFIAPHSFKSLTVFAPNG